MTRYQFRGRVTGDIDSERPRQNEQHLDAAETMRRAPTAGRECRLCGEFSVYGTEGSVLDGMSLLT